MYFLLLLAACQGAASPELYVRDAENAGDIERAVPDHLVDDSGDAASGEDTSDTGAAPPGCGNAVFTSGESMHIAWVLPDGVPDPDQPMVLRVESACATETRELGFSGGAALAIVSAPEGAEAGILVAVSALNASSSCTTAR